MPLKKDYPCKNCIERSVGCHATCEVYRAAKAEHVEIVQRTREENKGLLDSWDMRRERIAKTKRKNHDRKDRK